jgi:hypothetical protein
MDKPDAYSFKITDSNNEMVLTLRIQGYSKNNARDRTMVFLSTMNWEEKIKEAEIKPVYYVGPGELEKMLQI